MINSEEANIFHNWDDSIAGDDVGTSSCGERGGGDGSAPILIWNEVDCQGSDDTD